MAGSCEHGNESSGSQSGGEFVLKVSAPRSFVSSSKTLPRLVRPDAHIAAAICLSINIAFACVTMVILRSDV
jgi:hypothetical protein